MGREPGSWQQRWYERFYASRPGWVDGTTLFHDLVAETVRAAASRGGRGEGGAARILEIGSGPSNPSSRFIATLGELHGIDIDPEVRNNDALTSAEVVGDDWLYPYEDERFDVCVSNYVVEHVATPAAHLAEIARVLVPGGLYVFRTPNLWHPVALGTAFTPHWFHERFANRLRAMPPDAHPPWPTEFRLNTRGAIERGAARAGLRVRTLRLLEGEPSYGMSSRLLFAGFAAYERFVNSSELFAGLRINIQAVLEKRADTGAATAPDRGEPAAAD